MIRPALALSLLALLLSACAATEVAPPGHARGPGLADLHARPPVTTFVF